MGNYEYPSYELEHDMSIMNIGFWLGVTTTMVVFCIGIIAWRIST